MKAIGIIRNLDPLGRVVVPSSLRKTLNISVGDPIEFFTDDQGRIVLRKYQIEGALSEAVSDLQNLLNVYGEQIPPKVAIAMHEHVSEMKKLIDQEADKT